MLFIVKLISTQSKVHKKKTKSEYLRLKTHRVNRYQAWLKNLNSHAIRIEDDLRARRRLSDQRNFSKQSFAMRAKRAWRDRNYRRQRPRFGKALPSIAIQSPSGLSPMFKNT